jgi:hypothetical protein
MVVLLGDSKTLRRWDLEEEKLGPWITALKYIGSNPSLLHFLAAM